MSGAKRNEYSSKHEGLRMSSPPARMCAATSPRRKLLKAAELPILYAQPASVHFGGFALDQSTKTYQQRVFVHNNSNKSVRLQYTMPAKGFFRVAFAHQERKPFVSAGLCEELVVSFKPAAFQYHYDCIQVRCEEVVYASNTDTVLLGKCLIPIHAYPVLNEVLFPTRMDFGAVALGEIGKRHFDLSCSVPIEFEYELELAKAHPSFTIFPLRGTIPANGVARIELEFRPLIYATASAEVVLHISQLGFTPMRCQLAGSSSSDIPQAVAASGEATAERTRSLPQSPTVRPSASSQGSSFPSKAARTTGVKPRKKRDALNSEGSEKKEASPAMEKIGGLEIPADVSNMTSVNFILTQQVGKLKPKDLKKAVEASRELRKRQKEEQIKLSSASHNPDGDSATSASNQSMALTFQALVREEENFLKRTGVSRQIKEMFFAQELSDMEQMERELEFQSHKVHLGPELLTPKQVAFLQQIRMLNALELERRQREKMRTTFTPTAINAQSQPTAELPNPPRAMLPANFTPAYTPDFKTYKNDLWARRKRVVQKLIRAISTCILRARVQKRLEKIQSWLGGAKMRAQVQEKVALDWQRHGSGTTNGLSTKALATQSQPEQQSLYLESFPLVEEKSYTPREFIAQSAEWELKFDAFTFFPLRERDEALLSGHEKLELPPLPTYIPLERDRELRFGAEDEYGGPRLLMEDTSSSSTVQECPPRMDTRTPSLLQQLPPDIFLRPTASVRPLVRIQAPRETDSWYVLRPQRVFRTPPTHFGAIQEQSVGMRSLMTLQDSLLTLSTVFVPPTERPRAQPLLHWTAASAAKTESSSELFKDVWYVSQRPSSGIPSLAERPDDVPCLSDSESDNDGDEEDKKTKCPTWEDAQLLFEEVSTSEDSHNGNEDGHDETAGYEDGELLGRTNGIFSFERYRHLIRLERAYNDRREELLQLLPNVSNLYPTLLRLETN